ncbi:unnamed protein product [Prunus armeniaca]
MEPILQFLQNQTLPANLAEARRVRYRSARYLIINDALYKHGFSLPYLRCLTLGKVNISFGRFMRASAAITQTLAH